MERFTIRDIEQLCNIKAHTLRIWEQRYTFFKAQRKESRHRIYDNDDLKQLLRISFLYHNGWKISKIAALQEGEVTAIVRNTEINADTYKHFVARLLEAAVDFDEGGFLGIMQKLIREIGMERCVIDVCYPFLQRVGLLWTSDNLIPAQEHFSSYLIQHKIIAETDKLPLPSGNPKRIVLFTPKGEQHELPLIFINYLLKKHGWQTLYLGSNVSLEYVKQVLKDDTIKYMYLHLVVNLTGFEVDDYLESLCKAHLPVKIFASGTSIVKAQRNFLNFIPLKTDAAIYDFIRHKITP